MVLAFWREQFPTDYLTEIPNIPNIPNVPDIFGYAAYFDAGGITRMGYAYPPGKNR